MMLTSFFDYSNPDWILFWGEYEDRYNYRHHRSRRSLFGGKGYIVHGIKRRSSLFNTARVDHLYRDLHEENVSFKMHYGDLTDATNLIRIVQQVQPDEIYNLAAQSHVQVSFETPEYTANSDALGTLRLLEAGLVNKSLHPRIG